MYYKNFFNKKKTIVNKKQPKWLVSCMNSAKRGGLAAQTAIRQKPIPTSEAAEPPYNQDAAALAAASLVSML